MSFVRALADVDGLTQKARSGFGWLVHLSNASDATDAAATISAAELAGGLYTRSGLSVGRTDTSDTAVNILAANPTMDIGDSFMVAVSNQSAQSLTLAGGTGVTASGNLVVLTLTCKFVVFTKTSATTMTMQAL